MFNHFSSHNIISEGAIVTTPQETISFYYCY